MPNRINASFRDPAGFVFEEGGVVFRQINRCYADDYSRLLDSGLYEVLVGKQLLISHKIISGDFAQDNYIIIQPEQLAFISYPYEWSFNQLKDAALTTLAIQKLAMTKDMSLKDASAYNIQFHHGKAIFIDTLSYERYIEGKPWVAYRQFCQHFLAPLALMAKMHISLHQLLRIYIDGIDLSFASQILPLKTWFSFGLLVHIHLHAMAQKRHATTKASQMNKVEQFSKKSFLALIDNLESTIKRLQWLSTDTEWHDYYQSNNNYRLEGLDAKQSVIESFIKGQHYNLVWDLGANTGRFSQVLASHAKLICAWDIDPACVDYHYQNIKRDQAKNILPLLQNLTNPSAAIGWANKELASMSNRGPADLILALGLIHHLVIVNNIPISEIAIFFASIGSSLIVEFIPKQDSQVQKLLENRQDIFSDYSEEKFRSCFAKYFVLDRIVNISGTVRTLYLMHRKLEV